MIFRSEDCVDYLSTKMISNENCLNYGVIDLVEIYKFYTYLITI
jgi:hypothetical protein